MAAPPIPSSVRTRRLLTALLATLLVPVPFAAASHGDCGTPNDQRGAPLPIPVTIDGGAAEGGCTGTFSPDTVGIGWQPGGDVDELWWPTARGWDHTVVVEVADPALVVTATRSVNGTVLESVTGSGRLVLSADLRAWPNPHDREIREVLQLRAQQEATGADVAYTVSVSRWAVAPQCETPYAGLPRFDAPCEGALSDGKSGFEVYGPRPGEYRWSFPPERWSWVAVPVVGGAVTTLAGAVTGRSACVTLQNWGAVPVAASALSRCMRPASGTWASFSFRVYAPEDTQVMLGFEATQPDAKTKTITIPGGCGELGCWPSRTETYSVDQWDARSEGPWRFRLHARLEADAKPVARAAPVPDGVAYAGTRAVQLDGSASTDDFRIVAWEWRQGDAVLATTQQATVPFPPGSHRVTLAVRDDVGQEATTEVAFEVAPTLPPVADAGPDLVLVDHLGDGRAAVDGCGSRDDGWIEAFEWRRGGESLSAWCRPTLALGVGRHALTLAVRDAAGLSDTDETIVDLRPNEPPVADAGPDLLASDRDGDGFASVALDASRSRDSGPSLSYAWRRAGEVVGRGRTLDWRAPAGEHDVELTVTDAAGATATDVVRVTVVANLPPVPSFLHTCLLTECAFDARATFDPDGAVVAYVWLVEGREVAWGERARARVSVGETVVTLRAHDDSGHTSETSTTITIAQPAPLAPPASVPAGPTSTEPGGVAEPGDVLGGALDVQAAWVEVSATEIGLALKVADLGAPVPGGGEARYRLSFWAWGLQFEAYARMGPNGPAFTIERPRGAVVHVPRGSWNETTDIVWWAAPRDVLNAVGVDTSLNELHAQAWLYDGAGARVDTTRPASYAFPRAPWP